MSVQRRLWCGCMVFLLTVIFSSPVVFAQEMYGINFPKLAEYKKFYDDPRPLFKDLPYEDILSPEEYAKLVHDEDAMKRIWADVVGFQAPDVVGKIAPEITPGTYSYKDKDKYPGIEKLMYPNLYKRFKPGGPPHAQPRGSRPVRVPWAEQGLRSSGRPRPSRADRRRPRGRRRRRGTPTPGLGLLPPVVDRWGLGRHDRAAA